MGMGNRSWQNHVPKHNQMHKFFQRGPDGPRPAGCVPVVSG